VKYPNLRHFGFVRLLSENIARACGVNLRALLTHPQIKRRAMNLHGTRASKPPSNKSQTYGYVKQGVMCSLVRALEQCPSVALKTTCEFQANSVEFMGLIRQTPPTILALRLGPNIPDDG
jgi:hypothetical protein